jgi:hypothetical protein
LLISLSLSLSPALILPPFLLASFLATLIFLTVSQCNSALFCGPHPLTLWVKVFTFLHSKAMVAVAIFSGLQFECLLWWHRVFSWTFWVSTWLQVWRLPERDLLYGNSLELVWFQLSGLGKGEVLGPSGTKLEVWKKIWKCLLGELHTGRYQRRLELTGHAIVFH